MAETAKLNLYQKLLKITEEVGKIEKTGTNTSQNYKFIEQAKVVAEVRVQLSKHGVMIVPETVSRTMDRYTVMKPGYKPTDPPKEQATIHANVVSRYTLINADNPTEKMVCEWDAGEALDTSDKATNKATTASHKSFLMKLFNISDKDDPDAHSPVAQGISQHDFPPEEPARDVNEDIESVGVTTEMITKLGGQVKLKGIMDRAKIMNILNNLAKTKGGETIKDISLFQANELYEVIRKTDREALELLEAE